MAHLHFASGVPILLLALAQHVSLLNFLANQVTFSP